MKIDPVKNPAGQIVGTTQTRAGKSEKAGVSKTSSDSVSQSPQLQALEGTVANSGVFDANKVEEIKAAIAGGVFQVNPEKVADGLLDTVNDLLHARKA